VKRPSPGRRATTKMHRFRPCGIAMKPRDSIGS
jgi:hypothetical protein